ncbi:hypothetical protein Tco_1004899 [Tanacetum coccineum]|uniref:Uncharacterized protein n=1 Tax=Tanacetum coccineum TaxID=301880 RepID=A0ABQ5FD65_9ASTR
MVFSVASHKEEGSSSTPTPPILVFDLPEEIIETIGDLTFEKRAKLCYKMFLTILLKNHGLCIKGLRWLTTTEKRTYILVMFRRPGSFLPPKAVNDDGSDSRSLMARANGVDPNKIPYYLMWNISVWSKDHPDAYKWIKANGQCLYDNFDHCKVETSDDDDDARSLWLKPSTRKEPTFSQESQSIADVVTATKTPDVLPIQKDYEEFDNVESFEHLFMAELENAKSIVRFDAEEYEEHQENPNQETPTEFPKLQGRLRDWYHILGEYHQLQIQQSISPEAFMSIIYLEFIGSPWKHTTHAREEFLKMKCCSFQKKDLEKHYMSQRFYC